MLLIEDETIIRLYPPLRACWAMRGEQAIVPITGRNAKRVLFGVINPRTWASYLDACSQYEAGGFSRIFAVAKTTLSRTTNLVVVGRSILPYGKSQSVVGNSAWHNAYLASKAVLGAQLNGPSLA